MAKNWALVIGVNQYDFMQPLNYAKHDAQLMQEFLGKEVGFERVFFFSDDSPPLNGKSTRPNRSNLRQVLLKLFEKTDPPRMEPEDNFWFFFSGHGMRYNNRDYLMPSDGNPADIEDTAIPINFVSERLRRCGSDNVVLILDACRNQGIKGEGIGRQTEHVARTTGVISIFSCSPNEYSYEIDRLQQGAFTHALLEGLGIQGRCATVERLNQYLNFRVPELVGQHKNARQTPYMIVEPVNKYHLILVPRYATLADIAILKNDAYQAEVNKQLELAKQLWIRVNAAASGQDTDVVTAFERIAQTRHSQHPLGSANFSPIVENEGKSKASTPPPTSQPKNVQPPEINDLSSAFNEQEAQKLQRQREKLEYENNLRRYEQEFAYSVQAEYPLSQAVLQQLKTYQRQLGLNNEDVECAEQLIREPAEVKYQEKLTRQAEQQRREQEQEQAKYENNLRRYEQELSQALKAGYPLDAFVRNGLKKFQQSLGIRDEDVVPIEQRLLTPKQAEYERQQEAIKRKNKRVILRNKRGLGERGLAELKKQEQRKSSSPISNSDDDLSSDRNVNNTRLRDLLKAGNWKDADKEIYLPFSPFQQSDSADFEIYLASSPFQQSNSDDDLSSDHGGDYTENVQSSQTDDLSSDHNVNYIQPEIVQPPQTDDDLSSERNVDYTRLRDLLAAGDWKDADIETYLVMLQVVGREIGDDIRDEELLNFPCTDLRTIDGLWVKYSNGRFGFSVQKKIYLEAGGKPDGDEEGWRAVRLVGDRVGWSHPEGDERRWCWITDTTAPVGHLPAWAICWGGLDISSLASRLVNCSL